MLSHKNDTHLFPHKSLVKASQWALLNTSSWKSIILEGKKTRQTRTVDTSIIVTDYLSFLLILYSKTELESIILKFHIIVLEYEKYFKHSCIMTSVELYMLLIIVATSDVQNNWKVSVDSNLLTWMTHMGKSIIDNAPLPNLCTTAQC